MTTFGQINVNAPFWYDGIRYIKIDPVWRTLTVAVNAIDEFQNGFWFEDNDAVQEA